MEIKTITVKATGVMAAGQGIQVNQNQVLPEGNIFGPEYKVTISQKGRALSKQQAEQTQTAVQNAQNVKEVRIPVIDQEQEDKFKDVLADIFSGIGLSEEEIINRVNKVYQDLMDLFPPNGFKIADSYHPLTDEEIAEINESARKIEQKIEMGALMNIDFSKAEDAIEVAKKSGYYLDGSAARENQQMSE